MKSSTSNTQETKQVLTTDINMRQSHTDNVDYYYQAKLHDEIIFIRSGDEPWDQKKKQKILQETSVPVTPVTDINFNTRDVYELV